MIFKLLASNQFNQNYIVNAKFKISISKQDAAFGQVFCQCFIEDIEGRIYEGKVYRERAFPIADSMFEKIIKRIKWT